MVLDEISLIELWISNFTNLRLSLINENTRSSLKILMLLSHVILIEFNMFVIRGFFKQTQITLII